MLKGKYKRTEKIKNKTSNSLKGKHISQKTEFKIGHQLNKGENHPMWKGGSSGINLRLRNSKEFKLWKNAVFIRDNNTCIWCGNKNNLCADHIKSFALFPELRFSIDNGRILCYNCHKKTLNYAGRVNSKC